MELFELIPPNLFTILTSKNREVYVQALFVVRKAFKQNIVIDREILTNQIINDLQTSLYDIDPKVDEDHPQDVTIKDASSLAHFLLRRLKDTGWVEIEYSKGSRLTEYVTLPPYSVKLIQVLYDMCSEEAVEYNSYLYAMYSALLYADQNHTNYRYNALVTVHEKVLALEDALKTLFHNLKRRYTTLGHLKTVNQVLSEHFDSYQKDIIQQIYYPLKTKDSINRFKGSILKILMAWLRDGDTVNQMMEQAKLQSPIESEDEVRNNIISRINFIVDKLNELEELVLLIDERNNNYVSAATEKMRYLLRSDKSIKGKLTKILEQIAFDETNGSGEVLKQVDDVVSLQKQSYLDETSLYTRANISRFNDDTPLPLIMMDREVGTNLSEAFARSSFSSFSHETVMNYVQEKLRDRDQINVEEIEMHEVNELIFLMYSFLKGFEPNSFYRMELLNGRVVTEHFNIPNMNIIRRRNS